MRIQDLERRTGLERPTIRFYEREGLLNPKRLENGYREYSDQDAALLLKIKLLRQIGMSLDRVKALQQGSVDFSCELEQQIKILTSRIQDNIRARSVCEVMQKDKAEYETLNAEYYLKLLQDPGLNVPQINKRFRENIPEEIHPWRRFFARSIDYALFGGVLELVLIVILRIRPLPGEFMQAVIAVTAGALYIPVEALLLHYFGTTPGKMAMGIRVEWIQGGNLPIRAALERSTQVYLRGEGCRISFINIGCNYVCYCHLTGRAVLRGQKYNEIDPPMDMSWDCESELIYNDWSRKRYASMAAAVVVIAILMSVSTLDGIKPRYRGELTVSQFAENYNHYYALFNRENVQQTNLLQSDGTWFPELNNTATIYIDGEPEIPNQTFTYETADGHLTVIRYQNSWTDVFYIDPVPEKCKLAAITVLMSKKGSGWNTLKEFAKQLDSADFTLDGSLIYDTIELRWEVETENCILLNREFYSHENGELPSRVTTAFEIRINP